jgi:hypothetical protein
MEQQNQPSTGNSDEPKKFLLCQQKPGNASTMKLARKLLLMATREVLTF